VRIRPDRRIARRRHWPAESDRGPCHLWLTIVVFVLVVAIENEHEDEEEDDKEFVEGADAICCR